MAWQQNDRDEWLRKQTIQRSYAEHVLEKIRPMAPRYELTQYGALSVDPKSYPLYLLRSKNPDPAKPTILITGGVHGYETSGPLGAIAFLDGAAPSYLQNFNFVCFPCVSPWAFETINRWNNHAIDPNRSFFPDSPAEECRLVLEALARLQIAPLAHFDLHETTDTDNTIFRPAREQRDGITLPFEEIPDGFYVVGSSDRPEPAFQKAIVDEVRKVTHIAEPDGEGKIIGEPLEQAGVINYPVKKLFLCAGITDGAFVTTTEVYPDSPRVTPQIAIDAQVAAICGGLDYLKGVR